MSRILFSLARALPFVLVLLAPAGAAAQPERDFADRVDVSIVNLDAVVSDQSGRPIGGLTRGDFTLTVDGIPTEISNFSEITAAEEEQQRDPLHLGVYIDNTNLEPFARKQVLDSLGGFVRERLSGRDLVLIASGDRFHLDIAGGFTSDAEAILARLTQIQRTNTTRRGQADFQDSGSI